METSTTYIGYYKNENRETPIEIINNSYDLSFFLDGLQFKSSDLEEWTLANEEECTEEQLAKFSLATMTTKQAFNLVTEYSLKDCTISFSIPQQVLDNATAKELEKELLVTILTDGSSAIIDLTLKVDDGIIIETKQIADFDTGLKMINNNIEKKFTLFNCYNCRYSGYNVYGQSMFGSLLCYKRYKQSFLAIKDKSDYILAQEQGYDLVQETHDCDEFQMPEKSQFLYK